MSLVGEALSQLPLAPATIRRDQIQESGKNFILDDLPSQRLFPYITEAPSYRTRREDEFRLRRGRNRSRNPQEKRQFLLRQHIHASWGRIFSTMARATFRECERTISGPRHQKTFLRTTMAGDRMNGLLLRHIHYGMERRIGTIIEKLAARRHPDKMPGEPHTTLPALRNCKEILKNKKAIPFIHYRN